MGMYETFTKRIKRLAQAGQPDVYQYDDLPRAFRVQVAHIWQDSIGRYTVRVRSIGRYDEPHWELVSNTLARELGVFGLGNPSIYPSAQCQEFLLTADTSGTLDIIQLSFQVIDTVMRDASFTIRQEAEVAQTADEAIEELNHRFREHGLGYQFTGGELMRVDSQYLHAEAVKPALSLLKVAGFQGASEEFLEAHEHYRKGEYADAIADALKAFESTMKAICDSHGWSYPAGATAKTLVNSVLNNELVPRFMETHLSGLRNTLEAGLPVVRNKLGGHGQGKDPKKVHDYFAGYALHLAATNIVFLVEAHNAVNQ